MSSRVVDRPPVMARMVVPAISLLILAFIVWAAFAPVDEIARGDGKVIPVSKTQVIQASEPGVVQEIAVRPGQIVRKGDLLVRLDNTMSASSLGESKARSDALKAKIARLQFESGGNQDGTFVCAPELIASVPDICANEQSLFQSRRENYRNKENVLEARQQQRADELAENRVNIEQLEAVIAVKTKEYNTIKPLVARKLHAETDLLHLESDLVQARGQLAVASKATQRLEAAEREAALQINELEFQFQQDARNDLSQVLADLGVIDETIRGASDRVKRSDIRSPVDGIINTLDVNTIGAFVQAGAVVGGVVPTSDKLLVEARISPRDVAFVRRDQNALVKITAYDFSIYGGLAGKVINVSADSLVDEANKETYYQVLVQTTESELHKDGRNFAIMPGMVATVEIMTGRKTILEYLLKPINKARTEALTER